MKIRGYTVSRLRSLFAVLFLFVLFAPWIVELLHGSSPFPWRSSLVASFLMAGGTGVILLVVCSEIRRRKEVENRYREFLDDAPLGTYTIDRMGTFTYVNKKLLEISGFTMEEQLRLRWQDVVVPEDIPLVERKITEAFESGPDVFVPFEVRAFDRDGHMLHLILHYTLLIRDGVPEGFLVVVQDVTRRRKLEAQLVKSERLAVAGQLAMGIAHEINNPLAIMKTSMRLLKERVSVGEDVDDIVEDLQEEVERIAGMVRVLLGFRDERPGEKQVTSVDEGTQSLLHLMTPQLRKRNVETRIEWAGEGVFAAIRPSQFRQVMFNLVRNALDAMPQGGALYVRIEREANRISIWVRDTGVGIAHEDQRKLFEPFFSTKSSSHHGLGLYVCYTILKSIGGDVEVESKVGKGATFVVKLPYAESEGEQPS